MTALFVTLLLTSASGWLHGHISGRWGRSELIPIAAEKLLSLPEEFGEWELDKNLELTAYEQDELQPYAYVNRVYAHRSTGQMVNLLVLLGPVGPTAVHTPEICYSRTAYTIIQRPEPARIAQADGGNNDFLTVTLKSRRVHGELLRSYYAWTTGDRWEAASDTRFTFGGSPYLYKIQLSCHVASSSRNHQTDAVTQFLPALLPVLKEHLIVATP